MPTPNALRQKGLAAMLGPFSVIWFNWRTEPPAAAPANACAATDFRMVSD